MTLDVPCPGLLRLLVAVHSLRGENPTFAILELLVSAVFKGIHVACLRFLRQLLVMSILRSRLDNMLVFRGIAHSQYQSTAGRKLCGIAHSLMLLIVT
jgi:hypothetical protein